MLLLLLRHVTENNNASNKWRKNWAELVLNLGTRRGVSKWRTNKTQPLREFFNEREGRASCDYQNQFDKVYVCSLCCVQAHTYILYTHTHTPSHLTMCISSHHVGCSYSVSIVRAQGNHSRSSEITVDAIFQVSQLLDRYRLNTYCVTMFTKITTTLAHQRAVSIRMSLSTRRVNLSVQCDSFEVFLVLKFQCTLLFNFKNGYICFMFMSVLPMCLCTTFMPGAHRSQKDVLGSLELELLVIVSHHVDSRNWT